MVFKSTSLNSGVRATVFSFPMIDWNAILRLSLLTFLLAFFGIAKINGQCTIMVTDPVVDLNVGATNSATLDGAAIAGNIAVTGAGCTNFVFYDMLGNSLGASVAINCDGTGNGPGLYVVDVNDGLGSTSNMVQLTVNTIDPTDPTFTLPGDIIVNCQDDRDDLSITGDVTDEMDNCASGIQATYSDDESGLTGCNGTGVVVRTWTLDDGNGNSISMDQTITVQDVTSPMFTVPADVEIDACSSNINDLTLTGDVTDETDNCSTGIEATYSDGAAVPVPGGCANESTVTRTWTLVDDCSNATVLQQIITLKDITNPSSTQAAITQDNDTGVCGANITLTLDAGNTSDNCDAFGDLTISNDYLGGAGTADASGFYTVGTTTVTFTITDQCSNSIMHTVDVTVSDTLKPVIVNCPADVTIDNDLGNCDNSYSWTAPSASDNCSGIITEEITVSDASVLINKGTPGPGRVDFADFPVGTSTITYAFKDVNGVSDTCRFSVTVLDKEAPTITCPPDQVIDFGGCNGPNELVPDYRALVAVSDNCANGFTISQTPSPNSLLSDVAGVTPLDGESFTVTFTATDNNADNLFSTCSITVNLNEDGSISPDTPGANLPTLNSTCGSLLVCAPTAIDECGNLLAATPNPGAGATISGTCSPPCTPNPPISQAIGMAIADNSAAGTNYTITVAGQGPIIAETEFALEINHTWVGDLRATLESPSGTVINLFDRPGSVGGTVGCASDNLNLTFSDDAGNSAADLENTCNFGGAFAINGTFQSLDPLSSFDGENPNGDWILNVADNAFLDMGSVVGVGFNFCTNSGATINQYEFGVGSTTVTWTYDDLNGNLLNQMQLINVSADVTGPSFTCQDITVELDEDGSITVPAGSILGENIQFESGNLGLGSGAGSSDFCYTAAVDGSVAFDWNYNSNNSNAFFDQFGYTLNGTFTALATGDPIAIVDIPSLNQSGSFSMNLTAGDVFCMTALTADNAFGNGQTTVTNLIVNGGIFNSGDWTETTVNSDGGVFATSALATDNCGVDFSTLALDGNPTWDANCGNIGTNNLVLSLSDINGNPSTCLVNVTVEDNLVPTLTDVPMDVTVECGSIPTSGTPTVNDNCSTGLTPILNETSTRSGNPNTCSDYTYQIVRTWSSTDNAGNVAMASQVIQIEDNLAPSDPVFSENILVNGTISTSATSCDANVSLALTGLTDCAPFANLTISNNSFYALSNGADASGIYPVGTHNINFSVSDPCGNAVSFNRVFTVVDDVSPIASCKPAVLGLPSNGSLTLLPGFINDGSTDNCSPSGSLTLSVSPNQFDCSHADGVTQWPVTLTVTDQALNTATCNSTVVIQDNFAPTAICQDITVTLDDAGMASIGIDDINNGSFDNCTANDDLIIGITPTMFNETNVGLNNFVQLSVEDSNGNIGTCNATVFVDIPETCFEVGTMAGPAGSVVTVPITVSNFVNVGSFQFYLVASDPSILEIQNLTATSALGFGSFTFNEIGDDSIRVSYSIPGVPLTPLTLNDGETIVNVDVLLTGNVGDFSFLVLTDDDPNGFPIRVAHNFNGALFNRTPCTIDGGVSINAPASLAIAGDIFTEDADPIANAEVTITDGNPSVVGMQTTATDGMYNVFPVFANEDYTISPVKNTGWTNGVSAFDLSEIQKHVVGLDTLPTVYKKIAADAFKDGIITTFDVLQLQILLASAVGGPGALITPPGQTSWVFVPATDTPATTIPLLVPAYGQTIFIANLQTDTLDNDFIGVKIGDVTGNADPSTLTGDDAEVRSLTNNTLITDDLQLEAGTTITVPFSFQNDENWVAGQWVLDFDASVLKLIDAIPTANSGIESGDFGLDFISDGKLSVVAFETANIQSKAGQELFELVFEVKAENLLSEVLTIDESVLASNVYDENGYATQVDIDFNENQVLSSENQLLQNRPNPFVDETTIGFILAEAGNITLTISDIAGRVIMVIDEERAAGYQEIQVSRNDLSENGVYIYRLESGDFSAVKKMTLLSK